MDPLELHFCERGSDYSFQISLPPTATVTQLWATLQKEVLIPPQCFAVVSQEDENKIQTLEKFPQSTPLAKFPQFFENGGIITYFDTRFEPMTTTEEQYIKKLTMQSSVGHFALMRPPMFVQILKRNPQIYDQLRPPLSLLYLPNQEQHMPLRSIEFLAKLTHLGPSMGVSTEHRKAFWSNWVAKKDAFIQGGGVLVDNLDDSAFSEMAMLDKTDQEKQQLQREKQAKMAKFEVFSKKTEIVAKDELRYIDGLDQIAAAFEYANEYTPEIYGEVEMLYINMTMYDQDVTCFVDSGAQTTLISYDFAVRIGVDHLIDSKFSGKAAGVGSGNILGIIHAIKVKLGDEFFSLAFKVVDSIDLDVLLGLDNLKRYKMNINLSSDCLEFQGNTGKPQSLKFLSEGQVNAAKRQRIKAKVAYNVKLGHKRDFGFKPQDVYALKQIDDQEKKEEQKRLLAERQEKIKNGELSPSAVGSSSDSGNGGSSPFDSWDLKTHKVESLHEMVAFMIHRKDSFKQAMDRVNEEHEYKMISAQSLSNPNANKDDITGRPDEKLIKMLRSDNVVSLSQNDASRLNQAAQRDPQEILRMLQFLQQMQQMSNGGGQGDGQGSESDALANMNPEQLQQLLGMLAGSSLDGGLGGAGGALGGAGQGQQRVNPAAVDQGKLNSLVEMGFPRDAAMEALLMYGNDIDMAMMHLQGDLDEKMSDQ